MRVFLSFEPPATLEPPVSVLMVLYGVLIGIWLFFRHKLPRLPRAERRYLLVIFVIFNLLGIYLELVNPS